MTSKIFLLIGVLSTSLLACNTAQHTGQVEQAPGADQNRIFLALEGDTLQRIEKTQEEWKAQLDELEYQVLRQAGTERAFTGKFWDNKKKGYYFCNACDLPLFESDTKFTSGTGWPSFYTPLRADHVKEIKDTTYGMVRVEVVCARCDGHLGHVFNDGPKPTGLRYCMNSASLDFKEMKKQKGIKPE